MIAFFRLNGTFKPNAATLPIQLLSGRTGRLLWRAGPLPLDFAAQGFAEIDSVHTAAVEPGGAPDLFVRHGSPFVKPGESFPARPVRSQARRGHPAWRRNSGRDGRIVWDISLAEGVTHVGKQFLAPAQFADLDGDGGIDAARLCSRECARRAN